MKNIRKLLSTLVVVCIVLSCLVACGQGGNDTQPAKDVDYAGELKLDMTSETLKVEVTVHTFIDGDTTHFNVPKDVMENGILKARYLAINTPESTGKIEPYGKTASNFTKEKLSQATSIVIESDTSSWNPDSTGARYLVWVWYKTAQDTEYRNLNIEILQNGLALASNSAANRYGTTCTAAIAQAEANALHVYSGEKDPNFYYGSAVELTLKELRANIASYEGVAVAVTGVVTRNSGEDGVYLEAFDEESGMYNGMYIYYGRSADADMKADVLVIGNEVRIVGTVSVFNGSYQVSGLKYDARDKANSCGAISDGHSASYLPTDPATFVNGKVNVTVMDVETGEEVMKEIPYAEMALETSISIQDLVVKSVYTTDNGGSSDGAMTLTCEVDGVKIAVRTNVMRNSDGSLVTEDAFEGKTIDVKGFVDCFNGEYQIKVLSPNDIIIH